MPITTSQFSEGVPPIQRIALIAFVLCVHLAVLGSWASAKQTLQTPHEMSVSMMMPVSPQVSPAPPEPAAPTIVPAKPQVQIHEQAMPQLLAVPDNAVAPAPIAVPDDAVPTTPSLPDREPDFQAMYLNNPKPSYPMAARRMGWEGKVIVSVEVLANGTAGQVKLHQSSGHDALDKAAMQAVLSWKFVAARHAGQLINEWFLVPIPFILEEHE